MTRKRQEKNSYAQVWTSLHLSIGLMTSEALTNQTRKWQHEAFQKINIQ